MSEDEYLTNMFEKFQLSTLTEEEWLEFDTAFELPEFREDLNKELEKLKNDPCTEHRDKRMESYRNQIHEIDSWMEKRETPAPKLDATIFDELYIGDPSKKLSTLGRYVKNTSHRNQKNEYTSALSPSNFFYLEKEVFRISYLGKEIAIPVSKPLRDIAERLKYPHIEKNYLTEVKTIEHGAELYHEKEKAKGKIQDVNQKLSPENQKTLQKELTQLLGQKKESEEEHHSASKTNLSSEAINILEKRLDEINEKLNKLENYIRGYNGYILKDGSIKWRPCTDKNPISRQKDALSQNLRRGIKRIRDNEGEDLADHLEKYLLPDKYYRPPHDDEPFDVKI